MHNKNASIRSVWYDKYGLTSEGTFMDVPYHCICSYCVNVHASKSPKCPILTDGRVLAMVAQLLSCMLALVTCKSIIYGQC